VPESAVPIGKQKNNVTVIPAMTKTGFAQWNIDRPAALELTKIEYPLQPQKGRREKIKMDLQSRTRTAEKG